MDSVWINGKLLESYSKKIKKWKPAAAQEKVRWGLCGCGEDIYEGDTVGMIGDHVSVVCHSCWSAGFLPGSHADCAGLRLPDITLSN